MNIRDKKDLIEEIKKKKKIFEKKKISTRERHFHYQFSLQIWNQDSRNLVC